MKTRSWLGRISLALMQVKTLGWWRSNVCFASYS